MLELQNRPCCGRRRLKAAGRRVPRAASRYVGVVYDLGVLLKGLCLLTGSTEGAGGEEIKLMAP